MFALNIDKNNRILSACMMLPDCEYSDMPQVETLPVGNIHEYLYVDGEYIHEPLPAPEPAPPVKTETERRLDRIEAFMSAVEKAFPNLIKNEGQS